jgi:ribonuclease J
LIGGHSDLVVFSSKQIPGNEIAIGRMQNELAARHIDMITDKQAPVHVSGHPGRPELAAMYDWIRPEIIVPVHGEMRHMAEQARFAKARGIPHGIVQKNGDLIRLAPNGPEKIGEERVGRLILDGDVILPPTAHHERAPPRRHVRLDCRRGRARRRRPAQGRRRNRPQGVPVEDDRAAFAEARDAAADAVAKNGGKDEDKLRDAVRLAVRRCATEWTGKKPIVSVLVVRL